MAITVPFFPPILMGGPYDQPDIQPYPWSSTGSTPLDGMLVTVAAGVFTVASSGVSVGILGVMAQDNVATYATTSNAKSNVLAASLQATSGASLVVPQTNSLPLIGLLHVGQEVIMSVFNPWNANLLGTQFGVGLDPVTYYAVLDNLSPTTKTVFTVERLRGGPLDGGATNDVGVRVIGRFSSAALAIP